MYAFAVYMLLARFVSNKTQKARVGIRRMATLLGTGSDQILAALKVLSDAGLIEAEKFPGRVSEYSLLELKRGVPGAGTLEKGVYPERVHVYPEQVHTVPGAGTIQDLSKRLNSKDGKSVNKHSSSKVAEEIWERAKEELKLKMVRSTFDTWLVPSRGLAHADGVFRIEVKSSYAQDWCRQRLRGIIGRALVQVIEGPVEAEFVVKSSGEAQ